MIRTTVVVPNYKGEDYLYKCLDSLKEAFKSNGEFKVIVVDNGSGKEETDRIKDFLENEPNMRFIGLSENTGFAFAVNRGIEAADTPYVLLLNNDVTVKNDFVKMLEEALDCDENIFSANSVMRKMKDPKFLDGTGDYYCALGWAYAAYRDKPVSKVITDSKLRNIFSACGGASIYRKSILDRIGLFDEEHFAYLEDVDVGYRARIAGYRNVLCKKAVCDHAGSASSGSRYNDFKIRLSARNSIYIIYKNMPALQIVLNIPFLLAGFIIKILFFTIKGHGRTYISGLAEGFKLSFSKKTKNKRVRVRFKNIKNYIIIQSELWVNMFRRIFV
ncbi:MAG: glycosyltransferase family 2 protein [Lachnospiraceae bacterium]|nr:glycosyltransferase family 2 protein [Lachnospiraceae bacterium]